MAIIRGTTPPIRFILPDGFSTDLIRVAWVTFSQNGKEVFTEQKPVIEEGLITVKLSQKQTLKLEEGTVKIQVRFLLEDGESLASKEVKETVKPILKDGEIHE